MPPFNARRITDPFTQPLIRMNAARLARREKIAELWAQVQTAEEARQAAKARIKAGEYSASSFPWDAEEALPEVYVDRMEVWFETYDEIHAREIDAYCDAEDASQELDRFLHPRRYAKKGYRYQVLAKFYARARSEEAAIRRTPKVVRPPAERVLDYEPYRGYEDLGELGSRPSHLAPTPYQLGLTGNPDRSWADIGVTQPTPYDLFGVPGDMSWESYCFRRDPGPFYEDPEAEP